MAKIVDLRGTGGQMILLGQSFALPTSNAATFTANTPIVAGSMRYNPDNDRIEYIGKEAEAWLPIATGGGGGGGSAMPDIASGTILGRTSVGTGPASAITVGRGLNLSDGKITEAFNVRTANATTYVLTTADASSYIRFTSNANSTVVVPTNAEAPFEIGTQVLPIQAGLGHVSFTPSPGVTINAAADLALRDRWSSAVLVKVGTDTWDLVGDLDGSLDDFSGFSTTGHTHTHTDVTDFDTAVQALLTGYSQVGHTHTKAGVGLPNVDNTSDLNKPISNATQAALNLKANTVHTHVVADITDLNLANYANAVHTHVATDISDFTTAVNTLIGFTKNEWTPNFNGDADAYIAAEVAMTISQGNAQIGTGTIAYEKSTAAAPSTFVATTLPATLEAGAWLKVKATGVTGFVATHLKRTA